VDNRKSVGDRLSPRERERERERGMKEEYCENDRGRYLDLGDYIKVQKDRPGNY
jgi:hypothetical protein